MKKIIGTLLMVVSVIAFSCGGGKSDTPATTETTTETTPEATTPDAASTDNPSYDPNRGAGKYDAMEVGQKIDPAMSAKGEKVAELKCFSCHKVTDEKLVGPGWAGVTSRHRPEWIMNFMTNPDEMIDKDPKAQAMLEICMVRMPNQNLTDDDARSLLEYMRKNDVAK